MNQIKTLRRIAAIVLVAAGALTLAACNKETKTPYGSLSEENIYVSLDGQTVSETELYDKFRVQGVSVLSQMIDDIVLDEYLNDAETALSNKDEDALEYFTEIVNEAIFGTSDEESLADLYTDDNDVYVMDIEQFVDSMYLLNNTIDSDALFNEILALADTFEGYEEISEIVDVYQSSLAQYLYAKEQLALDVEDEDSDYYIEDEDIVTYYQANTEGKYDVEALVVRFINLNEANAALYQVGLKSDSKGLWYQIPDIRIEEGEAGYVDLNAAKYSFIKDILEDLELLGKLGDDYTDRSKISVSDFEEYYKSYTIDIDRDLYPDDELSNAEVKAKFVEIYNLLNPTTTLSIDSEGVIVDESNEPFDITYTYDDLNDYNTSLRSHVYTTLTAETAIEDATTEKAYSSRIQTFGDFRYLVYKLDDNSADEEGILVEDEDDEDVYVFADTEAADAAKAEALADLIDAKLTETYITTVVSALYDDVEVNIYDNTLRILYEQNYGYDGDDTNKTGDVLADVTVDGKKTDVLVDEFYNEVEKAYGINLAYDLLTNKILLASDEYTVTDDEYDDYEDQFEDIITAFSSDSYSSYPASMGREAFLLVAFGATSNEEAINELYVYPELRDQFLSDYEAHYTDFYDKMAQLAALQYDFEKSISVSHLLIYFDQDADGSPDDPAEYLAELPQDTQDEITAGLLSLVEEIYDRLGKYTDFEAGLSAITSEFNETGRILRGSDGSDGSTIDLQPELDWAEYRQLGFYMTYEDISSDITNTSNIITGSSVLDDVFYDRAISLYDDLVSIEDNEGLFPYLDFYDEIQYESGIDETDLELVQSSFGWHFIMVNSIGEHTSAIYSETDDEDEDYMDSDLDLNVYNEDSEKLTASQIEYYLVLSETDEGAPLPSEVEDAINTYLSPVTSLYTNTYMQRELIFSLLEEATLTDANASNRLSTIRAINIRQFHNYQLSDNNGVFDQNYNNLYGSWFDILEAE